MRLQPFSSNDNSVHRVIDIKGLHTTNVDVIAVRFIELFHSIRTAKKNGLLCGLMRASASESELLGRHLGHSHRHKEVKEDSSVSEGDCITRGFTVNCVCYYL